MNERILKLASSCFPRDTDGNINATTEMIAEFAELIVQECIAECWYDATPKQISDNIKMKFGVE